MVWSWTGLFTLPAWAVQKDIGGMCLASLQHRSVHGARSKPSSSNVLSPVQGLQIQNAGVAIVRIPDSDLAVATPSLQIRG